VPGNHQVRITPQEIKLGRKGMLVLTSAAMLLMLVLFILSRNQSNTSTNGKTPTVQIIQAGSTVLAPEPTQQLQIAEPTNLPRDFQPTTVVESIQSTPAPMIEPTSAPAAFSCPGAPQSRLIGQTGGRSTQGGLPLRVRAAPGKNGKFLGNLKNGESFQILDGPSCQNGMVWWKVSANVEGWVAEGDSKQYYIEPR
jgi:hypothetical protein